VASPLAGPTRPPRKPCGGSLATLAPKVIGLSALTTTTTRALPRPHGPEVYALTCRVGNHDFHSSLFPAHEGVK
jgi:hypothetical protein